MNAQDFALKVEGLRKSYNNREEALKGVDLSVRAGSFFGLLGANGAGKSTTLGILSGLVQKSAGLVEINGFNLDTQTLKAKATLGIVPQELNLNAFEKVSDILALQGALYGKSGRTIKIRSQYLLERLFLWEKRDARVLDLSGGMKRRLMIARALVHQPKLLLLDEPTAGVDVEIRRELWEFIKEINQQGTAVILTTHYLEEAEQLCDEVAMLHKGQIVMQGPKEKLLAETQMKNYILDLRHPIEALPPAQEGITLTLQSPRKLKAVLSQNHSLGDLIGFLTQHHIQVNDATHETSRLESAFLSKLTP